MHAAGAAPAGDEIACPEGLNHKPEVSRRVRAPVCPRSAEQKLGGRAEALPHMA